MPGIVLDSAAAKAAAQHTIHTDPEGNGGFAQASSATLDETSDKVSGALSGERDTKAHSQEEEKAGAEIVCPRCGAPMRLVMRGDEVLFFFYGCTRFAKSGCRGRRYFERDAEGRQLGLVRESCPECHQGLRKGVGRNGRPYCACFEKTDHKSGDAIFFNMDGTIKARPKPKGEFFCPECKSPLAYFEVQNGRYKGRMTFACLEVERHNPRRAHYWEDNNGCPAW